MRDYDPDIEPTVMDRFYCEHSPAPRVRDLHYACACIVAGVIIILVGVLA